MLLGLNVRVSNYLLDTCALVWWMTDAKELNRNARRVINDSRNTIFVSAATVWEIAIKTRRRRLTGTEEYLARHSDLHQGWGFSSVVIEPSDAASAGMLSIKHDDPFDRMLIVQAKRLNCPIVTCDDSIRKYADKTVW